VKIEYSILAALLALIYALIKNYLPDFPINPDMLMTLIIYVLLKLGVEVIGKPILSLALRVREFFVR
jgi:hypothetical protein